MSHRKTSCLNTIPGNLPSTASIGSNNQRQAGNRTSVSVNEASDDNLVKPLETHSSGDFFKNQIRWCLIDWMVMLGDNVQCLFDIEKKKILAEHILGEYQYRKLNSEEKNVAFLWSCFVKKDDLLKPLHRHGADPLSTLPGQGFTALHLAAFSGSVVACGWLLANGLELNAVRKNLSPLHCSVLANSPECTKLLLRHDATIGNTVLHCAVKLNAIDCLQLLLDGCANINSTDENGCTAMHVAAELGMAKCLQIMISYRPKAATNIQYHQRKSVSWSSASEGINIQSCQLQIADVADVDAVNRKKQTALHLAAKNHSTYCTEILLNAGCDVNVQDEDNRTPLHMVCLAESKLAFNVIESILKRGADVKVSDRNGYTPLQLAAKYQSYDCLKMLLDAGSDVNAKAKNGNTLLVEVLHRPNLASDFLQILLDTGADVHVSDRYGYTPLHLAAKYQGIDCIEILLDAECNVNAKAFNCSTPLLEVLNGYNPPLNSLKLLLNRGADVNVRNSCGYTPLHLAAKYERTDYLELLLDAGCDVNATAENGKTTLLEILHRSELALDSLKLLLNRGANVNVSDRGGYTPLHLAIKYRSTDCLEILLDAGCNVNAKTFNGSTPLVLVLNRSGPAFNSIKILLSRGANVNVRDLHGYTPLHLAAKYQSTDCLEVLLDAGCDVNATAENGNTTLLEILNRSELALDSFELLLNRGANVNVSDRYGYTLLHLAVKYQSTVCFEKLLDNGCNVNVKDVCGRTPLHTVLQFSSVEPEKVLKSLAFLLKAGADVNASDRAGYTPLHVAALTDISASGISQIVDFLITDGADVTAHTKDGLCALSIISRNSPGSIDAIRRKLDSFIIMNKNDHEVSNTGVELIYDFCYLLQNSVVGEVNFLKTLEAEGQKHLIEHPLCKAFLYLKWQKIRKLHYFHLLFYFVFVVLLTAYVVYAIAHECYHAAHDISPTARQMCSSNSTIDSFFFERPHVIEIIWYLLVFMAIFESVRKIMIIPVQRSIKRYFYQVKNISEWFVVFSVFLVSYFWRGQTLDWQKSIGGLAALLAWTNLMIMIGQLPIFGIYVTMFTKVQVEFLKLLIAYSCLLIGFTASFCVFFPSDETFINPLIGFIKILTMMTGEVDFEMLKENPHRGISSLFCIAAYSIYTLFLIFVAIILMNLLVGIAVNDIQGLQKNAGLSKLARQTDLIYCFELTICKGCVPKTIVELLHKLALASPDAHTKVLRVHPFDSNEEILPKEVMTAAFDLAKQQKKKTDSSGFSAETPRYSVNSIHNEDE